MATLYERMLAATDRDTALEQEFSSAIGTQNRQYMAIPILLNQLPVNWRFMWFQDHADPTKRIGEQCVAKLYAPDGRVMRIDAKHLGGAMCAAVLKAKGLDNI